MDTIMHSTALIKVKIRYNGTIRSLSEILKNAFHIVEFDVEPSEYPPYRDSGSFQALGWEGWLDPVDHDNCDEFILEMRTTHLWMDSPESGECDLSPWFSRYVKIATGLSTSPAT